MKLHFTQPECSEMIGPRPPDKKGYAEWMQELYLSCPLHRHSLTQTPDDADIILFWEPDQAGEFPRRDILKKNPVRLSHTSKSYVVNFEDGPIGFMPGAYTSMPTKGLDLRCFRPIAYPLTLNPFLEEEWTNYNMHPTHLAAFAGAATHPLRNSLFEQAKSYSSNIEIHETPKSKFFTTSSSTESEQRSYARKILGSHFSLCPRGASPSSYRLFESMQLGRVPVIISDAWSEPTGPDWRACSIRILESMLPDLESILKSYLPYADEMGRQARREWEEHFAASVISHRIVEEIVDLHQQRALRVESVAPLWELEHTRHPLPFYRKLLVRLRNRIISN